MAVKKCTWLTSDGHKKTCHAKCLEKNSSSALTLGNSNFPFERLFEHALMN